MEFSEWTDRARVKRVARDARLQLEPLEEERLALALSALLTMLDKADIPRASEATLADGVWDTALREDVLTVGIAREELLRSAAKTDGVYFVVGQTVEDAHEN